MRATIKYPGQWLKFRSLLALLFGSFCMRMAVCDEPNFLAEAETAYKAAQTAYSTNTQSLEASVDLARTAFDYADLAPNDTIRENVANNGIATARAAILAHTNSVAAHYYLALNIGQLARTKMLGALKLLTEMERELKLAIQLDPKFDYAGGHRTLGVLYLEAPGWPTSVGDKKKARLHLEKAVELAPEFPDNHLSLLEALVKWREWKAVTNRLADYQETLMAAKAKFTGPDWAYEWHDWTHRLQTIQTKLQKK
jgi:tetratricopeptide (TPR) repeat protein